MRIVASLLFVGAACLACVASPALAQQSDHTCVVSDPTGTQLNVRETPNGRIVGSIANGVWVQVTKRTRANGKSWAFVHDSDMTGRLGPALGWVFDAYLKCL